MNKKLLLGICMISLILLFGCNQKKTQEEPEEKKIEMTPEQIAEIKLIEELKSYIILKEIIYKNVDEKYLEEIFYETYPNENLICLHARETVDSIIIYDETKSEIGSQTPTNVTFSCINQDKDTVSIHSHPGIYSMENCFPSPQDIYGKAGRFGLIMCGNEKEFLGIIAYRKDRIHLILLQ